jgi:hypothetical protein
MVAGLSTVARWIWAVCNGIPAVDTNSKRSRTDRTYV